jgi:hypothetical protein
MFTECCRALQEAERAREEAVDLQKRAERDFKAFKDSEAASGRKAQQLEALERQLQQVKVP